MLGFLSCLDFSIQHSVYTNIILKPKQVICLESLFLGKDVLAILPTGFGKSLIFHLLPHLLSKARKRLLAQDQQQVVSLCVIVISPLNSLIQNQISRLRLAGVSVSVLKAAETDSDLDEDKEKLVSGLYDILFAHPEAIISCKFGCNLLHSEPYQKRVAAIVVDEAHCILEWGPDFRRDYSDLQMVCASFPTVPVLALTATANKEDREAIKSSLGIDNAKEVVASPDRKNIFYMKYIRKGFDIDSIQNILLPIAEELLTKSIEYPLTIIYLPLRWCGFAYRLFENVLGDNQYYPSGSANIPSNRLFAQYHAPQTEEMKQEIMERIALPKPTVRVVFATVAMGMGVDISSIRQIIHIGPPRTIRAYLQETGRAGRDGKSAKSILYWNYRDIAKNKAGLEENIRAFCKSEGCCLRMLLLRYLDISNPTSVSPQHLCCIVCTQTCSCSECSSDSVCSSINELQLEN